jgi:hypothetical protein
MGSRSHAVRGLRALALGLIVLGAGSGLYAVPVLHLTGGGGHTTDITSADCTIISSGTCIVLFNPADLLGLDPTGLGTLGLQNDLGQTIIGLDFFLPTVNFNQNFIASTDLFTNASLNFTPAFRRVDGYTLADFSGTGTGSGGTASANPCTGPFASFFNCPTNGTAGFDTESLLPDKQFPNGEGFLVVNFGTPNSGPLGGLAPCPPTGPDAACVATFESSVPEPGSFLLLLSAMGVVVMARRKIHRR